MATTRNHADESQAARLHKELFDLEVEYGKQGISLILSIGVNVFLTILLVLTFSS
jgi:hypothetical protein